jgi:hypothetical protein
MIDEKYFISKIKKLGGNYEKMKAVLQIVASLAP